MHPFRSLAALPGQLQHPQVRDLAWTLLSPPLLARVGERAPRHPLSASAWAAQPEKLARWLEALDRQPQALLARTPGANGPRLGHYYEELWQFALAEAPGIRLLGANLPIRTAERTLGELDLLLEDDEGMQHVELAVKFYLGPAQADGRAARDWLGPGRRDRLDRKLDHLLQHQLPLAGSSAARGLLQAYGCARPHSSPWLGGYLFYPWPTPCSAPAQSADDHLRGRWLRRSAWPAWLAANPGCWQPLTRLHWLAPAACDAAERWSAAQLAGWLNELPGDATPRLLVQLQEEAGGRWQERQRIFLVDDRWPQAPA